MTDLRTAAQQALAFTMRDFASLRDFEASKAVLHDNLRAALAQQEEPVQEPVAWLDGPHLVVRLDIRDRLNYKGPWVSLGRAIPDKWTPFLYLAPPQRKPLTQEEVEQCFWDAGITIKGHRWTNAVRNVERAHGIVACDNIKE